MEDNAQAEICQERRHHPHHADRDDDAEGASDSRGEHVVSHALGKKHLHEVAALRADGADHPHLYAALGGEHHEDEEDQHHAGCDGEQSQNHEERR